MLAIDTERLVVTVEPGVTLRQLRDVLTRRGLTLPSWPMLLDQTVAGAAATGSHGSSARIRKENHQVLAQAEFVPFAPAPCVCCSGCHSDEARARTYAHVYENRIERNLKHVSSMLLVSIPQDESISLDRFVDMQEKFIKDQAALMAASIAARSRPCRPITTSSERRVSPSAHGRSK